MTTIILTGALFPFGQIVATPGALDALEDAGESPISYLLRHGSGDWGDLCEEDKAQNERAVIEGSRVFSAYRTGKGVKLYVITESDRSVTTLLLPSEY